MKNNGKKVIFFHPAELGRHNSGSGIRPYEMFQSLQLNCDSVENISGIYSERLKKIKNLKKRINAGEKFDLLYVENTTLPLGLLIKRIPILNIPFYYYREADKNFIEFLIEKKIMCKYFYRDIYWDFDEVWNQKKLDLKTRYILHYQRKYGYQEIHFLKNNDIQVKVPSKAFSDFLFNKYEIKSEPLSPGSKIEAKENDLKNRGLNLLYVGGISKLYMSDFFVDELANSETDFKLNLVCRKNEYDKEKSRLTKIKNLIVHHLSGKALYKLYQECNIALFPLLPTGYGKLSYSIKIPEYICQGKPIIALKGTVCGNLVEKHNIGWVISPNKDELISLLEYLNNNPEEILIKTENTHKVKHLFTWDGVVKKLLEQ